MIGFENKSDDEKAKEIKKYLGILENVRQPYEAQIDNVIKFVNHGRRLITDKDYTKGQKTGIDVYDGTALAASTLLSDGIHGHLCSQNLHWFDFTLPGKFNFPRTSGMRHWSGRRMDEYPEVKEFLRACEDVQYAAFMRSNFYNSNPEYIREGATIGTATTFIEEDPASGRIYFTLPHFRECYIAENQFGVVDTCYRVFKYTLSQLVDRFGYDKIMSIDARFKQGYENNPYEEKEIIHAVFPRKVYDPKKINGANRPIARVWVMKEPLKLIEEDGYYDPPFVTWRWRKNNDEIYGRSPAWDCYVDVALANQQGKTNLIAGHKMVTPPMLYPADLRGKVNDNPGGKTFIDSQMMAKEFIPRPLNIGIQLPYGVDQQERVEKKIKEHFHVDFFLMLYQAAFNKVDLTATQVIGMQGEQAAVLGTRIGRFGTEGLDPQMDRIFYIEDRAGRMPEPPAILREYASNGRIEIDYLGPLAQAQRKLFNLQGIRAGIELAGQIMTIFPSSIDKVDGDKTMERAMDSTGFPIDCMRDEEQVNQIRMMRQQEVEAQRDSQEAEAAANAVPDLSKPIEEGSPLDILTKGLGSGSIRQ